MRQTLAYSLLRNPRVGLANFHVSGRRDNATAFENMRQAERGQRSRRSAYQRAPGGAVYLDTRMLWGMHYLTRSGWSFRVTELAGGSHSAINVDQIPREFSSHTWVKPTLFDLAWLPAFKRSVYREVLRDFFGVELQAREGSSAG